MNDFENQFAAFLNEFGRRKQMVLSTSLNDQVTSRMMSVIQKDGNFYFQTDKTFRKYNQLIQNKNIALCIDNIQIEGICTELGHPLEDSAFSTLYKECFSGSFEKYSSLGNEVLFMVTPLYVERWIYRNGVPFVETFNVVKKEYHLYEYKSV